MAVKKSTASKTKVIYTRVTREEHRAMKQYAASLGWTVTMIVRQAIKEVLRRSE